MADAATLFRTGLSLLQANRAAEALPLFIEAAKLRPELGDTHHMVGITLHGLGRLAEAEAAIGRAIARNPREADYHANRALVRCGLKRFDAAIADALAALALAPAHFPALTNLGLAQLGAKRQAEAAEAYLRALGVQPSAAATIDNLAIALSGMSEFAPALAIIDAALALRPDELRLWRARGALGQRFNDRAVTLESFRRVLRVEPEDAQALSACLVSINYLDVEDEPPLALARRYGAVVGRVPAMVHRPEALAAGRLPRLGLVSGDLRQHSVSYFLLATLPALQQRGFELFAYQTRDKTDAITGRLRQSFAGWRDISAVADADAARMIAEDRVDILIDLSGHTNFNRLPLFALRPAPVQMSWLGYPATTGVATIDYVIADAAVLPASEEHRFTERPLRLPRQFLCFAPPDVTPPPLADIPPTFGSFNTVDKLSDRTVALWSRILAATPASRLLLKGAAFHYEERCRAVAERFGRFGIAADRLTLLGPAVTRQEHLASYGRMHLALDPMPYAGTTTTFEALSMGVPVLSMWGEHFAGRVSADILDVAGLGDWVASDADDYVRRAVAAIADLPRLAALRPLVRDRLLGSPLCDAGGFARDFGEAMQWAWLRWCLGTGDGAAEHLSGGDGR